LALVFASALPAQIPRPPDQPLHFSVFSAQPIAGLSYLPRPNTAAAKLIFYPTARSPRYDYRGAMPVRFVDSGSGAVVAEVTVPLEFSNALLLFSPIGPPVASSTGAKPATTLKYRVAVLDDGGGRQPAGSLAIINFSGLALNGIVDGKDVTLKDGLNAAQTVARSAKILLRASVKGRIYQAYAETLQLKKNERALLILFPPFYRGSFEVQSRLLVDEPPGAAAPSPH